MTRSAGPPGSQIEASEPPVSAGRTTVVGRRRRRRGIIAGREHRGGRMDLTWLSGDSPFRSFWVRHPWIAGVISAVTFMVLGGAYRLLFDRDQPDGWLVVIGTGLVLGAVVVLLAKLERRRLPPPPEG
jgi:hypothetical protein